MGAAASMDRWEEPFCARLAAAGRHVIRYDHRDTGGSTTWPPGEPGYTGDDLLADAVGVLDHLGVERAHVAGLSMGGGLAQDLAVRHPGRVRTLTLMSHHARRLRRPGAAADVGGARRGVLRRRTQPAPPDWADREAALAHLLEAERPYAGARGIDEPAMRELLGRVLDRSPSPASGDNHFVIDQGEGITHEQITAITAPTLVIHGTHDPLFPPAHGEALAAAIPGARLLLVDGLGHELPRWAWDAVLPGADRAHSRPRGRSGRHPRAARRNARVAPPGARPRSCSSCVASAGCSSAYVRCSFSSGSSVPSSVGEDRLGDADGHAPASSPLTPARRAAPARAPPRTRRGRAPARRGRRARARSRARAAPGAPAARAPRATACARPAARRLAR